MKMEVIKKKVLLILVLSSVAVLCINTEDDEQQHTNNNKNQIGADFLLESSSSTKDFDKYDFTFDEYTSLETFHRHKKNKTHIDTSCFSHKNCNECTQSSWGCHWCAHDNACHARASTKGCIFGVTCNKTKPAHENTTCSSHTSCSECTLSSWSCHWCAHDNACHSIGSRFGCVSGVDCYSDDQCQRKEPKYVDGNFMQDVGFLPTIIILILGLTCCCCSTILFCISNGVKSAFNRSIIDNRSRQRVPPSDTYFPPALPAPQQATTEECQNSSNENSVDIDPLMQDQGNESEQGPSAVEVDEDAQDNNIIEEAALLESHIGDQEDEELQEGYRLLTNTDSSQDAADHAGGFCSNFTLSMFDTCRLCYIFSLFLIVVVVVLIFRYYPKFPLYNLCNNDVRWESIITGMFKFQAQADFQLLLSILNPNHFEIAVDMGSGSFTHNGVFVGNFDIPATKAPAMSIIDVLVIAHFSPGVWESLSLSKEYYDGTLAFDVGAKATIRTPILMNYSFSMDFTYLHLLVNDPSLDDRQLCACPTWDDNTTNVELSFLEPIL